MSEGFEIIDAAEFEAATKPTPRAKTKTATDEANLERTRTNWFNLQTQLGECTMPSHNDVLAGLGKLELEYRRRYPVRMVLKRSDTEYICRDCWQAGQ